MVFKSRGEAGKKLVKLLGDYKNQNTVVYALPRGGVVIGAKIAKALGAPLDLIITRKIGHPNQPELAIAAVSENGNVVVNPEYKELTKTDWFLETEKSERAEAKRRREVYLKNRQPISCTAKTAIITDDGIATGLTLKSAIEQLKTYCQPKKIIIAVPVIPEDIARQFEKEKDISIISLERTGQFLGSVGAYYLDFSPVEDRDVMKIMRELTGSRS